VLVVLLVAAAVILGGMIVVAIGRGGEMTEFTADVRPVDADIETAADVALLRPPVALWGYDKRSTDDALNLVARTVTERDVEIATLRRQIADMQSGREKPSPAPPGGVASPGAITPPGATRGPGASGGPGQGWDPGASGGPGQGWDPGASGGPGQGDPGSNPAPFVRRQASPAPPPAETQPWSAWERPGPEPRPDDGEPADPGEPG
jgi:hypothetical protein